LLLLLLLPPALLLKTAGRPAAGKVAGKFPLGAMPARVLAAGKGMPPPPAAAPAGPTCRPAGVLPKVPLLLLMMLLMLAAPVLLCWGSQRMAGFIMPSPIP
jgi:hypothetical protein